jgi:hypothetical protein
MAAFVNTNRMVLLGAAGSWTGTAPGPTVVTPSGTITAPQDVSAFVRGGGDAVYNANMVDITNFGSLGYTVVIPGITSGDDLVLECNSDFAASQLRAIVFTTLGGIAKAGSAPIYFDIKPTNAARSATNPSFVGAGHITKWSPVSGNVGEAATAALTIAITGTFVDLTS